jgi:cytochrome c556
MLGCGGGPSPGSNDPAGSAGSDHAGSSGSAGSDGAQAHLEGVAGEPVGREELEKIMKENNSLMKLLKMTIRERNTAEATKVLEQLAANATTAMRSKPDKNEEQIAGYLALYGAQRTTAQGLKSLVELDAWDAMGPSLATLGKNCMTCHKQYRLSPSQQKAREEESRQGSQAAAPATTGS